MPERVFVAGARYLGRAIAEHFASQGASVAVMARTAAEVEALVVQLQERGATATAIVGDLTLRDDVERAVAICQERFGGLDLAVNAITPGGRFGHRPFVALEDIDLDLGLSISLRGAFRFLQSLGNAMATSGGGCLVQIGTSSGLRIKEGFVNQAAVQHAVRALTLGAARELRASRVHVAYLPCDGGIESGKTAAYTSRVGQDKMIPQEEVARAVEFLFRQDPRAWTHELLLRPIGGDWTAPV